MSRFEFTGNKTRVISFPLGGIGTGCIGLAGNGRLVDWEIYNRPNKGSVNGFSHFAIKAEREGRVVDARVLHGDLHPPYMGELPGSLFASFGFGPRREYLTGLPHFESTVFRGKFPTAEIDFVDPAFPGQVRLCAFNPLIPLNDRDSGIPAAFFEIEVTNTTGEELHYSLAGVLSNPLPAHNINHYDQQDGVHRLYLDTDGLAPEDTRYGNLTLATDEQDVSVQRYWFKGAWFDNLEVYWHDFAAPGRLKDRTYSRSEAGDGTTGMLAAHFTLQPGQTHTARFVISWYFPNVVNYWKETAAEEARQAGVAPAWRNYYAVLWEDSADVARGALGQWVRLKGETLRFQEALFASSLPEAALDAVSANLSVLKSPTVMRLEDGTFYGFEGCHPASGCCEGSCTHVWNYAQALPFLFPKLERSMREADYRCNARPDGGMPFRIQLPVGSGRWAFRPCADGQFGGVMKAYRDWKICGDTEWLRGLWPAIRASIEFAWAETNEDRWDPQRRGVLTGRQHHTLDMELFGPNAWLTGFYLGALKAGAEMAAALGESETAADFRALFEKGKAWADAHLFNGEYYAQLVDLKDRAMIKSYDQGTSSLTGGALQAYWNQEHQEIKYQIADGCEIDQVLAQWHANLYGLGEIYDPIQVKTALESIFKYNFKRPMRDYYNPCRIYCLNDEGGLVIATWPEGKYKPVIPLPYSQETQNGYEYAAAIQMIQAGLVEEGLTAVTAIRDRYDGEKRNPWNEFECGSNYARSMAAYSLLNAFSGFQFDLVHGKIGFSPILPERGGNGVERFRTFWSLDPGWGEFILRSEGAELRLAAGELRMQSFELATLAGGSARSVRIGEEPVAFEQQGSTLHFPGEVRLSPGNDLRITFGM
jgi:non-lysosomal glucosylceramidase